LRAGNRPPEAVDSNRSKQRLARTENSIALRLHVKVPAKATPGLKPGGRATTVKQQAVG